MAGPEEAALRALISGLGREFKKVGGNGVTQSKDRSDAVVDALEALVKKQVLVGIPAEAAERKEDEELNNAARLYIHEFGAPEANIPARPTLMPGIRDAQEGVNKYFRASAKAAIAGDAGAVDVNLHRAGTVARDAVKEKINSNIPPPLAAVTIAKRIALGVTRTNTLVMTGQMRNAVTYVVRDK